ncbi:MAG: glycogen debranching enzyme, partial [Phycisphaerales bacterium]|nr:glycogen debranching enzyme [Phycisphaerales bacterium]
FRQEHPVFRRRKWFHGRSIHGSGVHDIVWFNPDGGEMTEEQWHDGLARAIGIFLNGEEIATPDRRGERIIDDSFILLLNADGEAIEFSLPEGLLNRKWRTVMDTAQPRFLERGRVYSAEAPIVPVVGRTLVVLQTAPHVADSK